MTPAELVFTQQTLLTVNSHQGGRGYAAAQLKCLASMTVSCAKVQRSKRRLAALLAAILSLLPAVIGSIAAVMAGQAAFLPYNSEGRHFDGVVVHHDGAQFIFGAIALVAWAMAGGMAWFAYRWARHGISSGRAPEKPRIA